MTAANRSEFAGGMLAMGETFGESVSSVRIEAYFDVLRDLPIEVVLPAMHAAMRDRKFFPRPVEIRELAVGSTEDLAELAWTNLLQMVRRIGFYGTPVWPDDATRRAALELFGGWQRLCEMLPDVGTPSLLGYAKQFKATFKSYASLGLTRPELPPISRDEAKQLLASFHSKQITDGH